MIVNKIICDRCDKEIAETHPPKMIVEEWGSEPNRPSLHSYRRKATIHLCPKREKDFKEFLKG